MNRSSEVLIGQCRLDSWGVKSCTFAPQLTPKATQMPPTDDADEPTLHILPLRGGPPRPHKTNLESHLELSPAQETFQNSFTIRYPGAETAHDQ